MSNTKNFSLKDFDFPLTVLKMGHDEIVKMHSHDCIELVYVDKGFSMHRAENQMSLLIPGDIFYIAPGTRHEYWKSVNNVVYNCLFYPNLLDERSIAELLQLPLLDSILSDGNKKSWSKTHLKPHDRLEMLGLLVTLEKESKNRLSGWTIRSKAILTEALVCLSRAWENHQSSPMLAGVASPASYEGILSLLEQSVLDRVSIEDVAHGSGYSPDHFARIFKKLTGLSPSVYLTYMRVAFAAEKLLDPSVPISNAAEMAGFEDINYFSRIFKREMGLTPSQFRDSSI